MRTGWRVLGGVVIGVALLGGAACPGPGKPGAKEGGGGGTGGGGTANLAPVAPEEKKPTAAVVGPGETLIAREREVWTLEGLLVAEADAILRAPEAKQALGDPARLRFSDRAEADVRRYLRGKRSAEVRGKAKAFLATLNRPTRAILDGVAEQTGLSAEDVFMDYLTYDGLLDLAIMRYGYKRWKAGAYSGDAKALADSFFSLVPEAPSAKQGIKVESSDDASIVISVFGARVVEKVQHAEVHDREAVGRVGVVEWTSNYEILRAGMRGGDAGKLIEELEWDAGGFRVNYAVELDEYLTWNATNPWAAVLYMTGADEVADMQAGAAAAGGFEAKNAKVGDAGLLGSEGVIGKKERGLTVKVVEARSRARLGATTPRRGQFLLVTVEVASTLPEELRAPAEWFELATAAAAYPELGVARPGLAPAVLPTAPKGARLLGMPYTALKKGKKQTLVLIYDVPADVKTAALVLGADELALKVVVK